VDCDHDWNISTSTSTYPPGNGERVGILMLGELTLSKSPGFYASNVLPSIRWLNLYRLYIRVMFTSSKVKNLV
jgi:hypothetical protein